MLSQRSSSGFELFRRTDGAGDPGKHFLRGLHLASNFVGPVVRYVAGGADSPDPGAVGEVDRGLQFGVDVVLVAAGTEHLRVGELHGRVEAAPENDAHQEATEGQEPQAVVLAGAADDAPVALSSSVSLTTFHLYCPLTRLAVAARSISVKLVGE